MTRRQRGRVQWAVVAVILLGAAGLAQAQEPIRIGASLSLTGSYAVPAQNQHRGYQLCAKHVNDKGGVLGRPIEFAVYDDRSDAATGVRLYEKLITQDKVSAVLGPYSSGISEAVANVTEKYRMPLVTPTASTTSIFRKGRRFIFMVASPAEAYLEGLLDLAARRGLKTVAFVNEDTLFPKSSVQGALEFAKQKGLQVVLAEAYPKGTTDFAAILTKLRALNPDVLGASTYFDDAVALTRQMKELDVNPRMYGVTVGGDLPKFHDLLGKNAEFVYGATQWEPELPYPGAREFGEAYRKSFPGADLSYHSAVSYAGCQVLLEGIRRAGSLDGEKIRDAILLMNIATIFGTFKVDAEGFQTAHKMSMFQWQGSRKVVVWLEEVAQGKALFPTPPWKQR